MLSFLSLSNQPNLAYLYSPDEVLGNLARSWAQDGDQVGAGHSLPSSSVNSLVSQGSGVGWGIRVITSARVNALWGEGITQHSPALLLQGHMLVNQGQRERAMQLTMDIKMLLEPETFTCDLASL